MLVWLSRRLGGPPRGVCRVDRRALTRLARLPRGEVRKQARRLRALPEPWRTQALSLLPAWQAEPLRQELRRGR